MRLLFPFRKKEAIEKMGENVVIGQLGDTFPRNSARVKIDGIVKRYLPENVEIPEELPGPYWNNSHNILPSAHLYWGYGLSGEQASPRLEKF